MSLSEDCILSFLNNDNFHHWKLLENDDGLYLEKKYSFKNFMDAFAFLSKVSMISEKLNHHPKMIIDYNSVTLVVVTNEGNSTITNLDLELIEDVERHTGA